MNDVLLHYLTTFGWALTGSIAMGIGIIVALKLFDYSTRDLDEWKLIKEGNMAMATILAAIILSLAIVIAAAIRP
jgi:uncharacterized membrane protein YjfL (UPF0719 family)